MIRILHVDDSSEELLLFRHCLRKKYPDAQVFSEETVTAALACLLRQEVDCIVSDLQMPGLNGVDFYKLLIMGTINIPFVLFTSHAYTALTDQARQLGVTDIICKDRAEQMFDYVDQLIGRLKLYDFEKELK